MFALEKNNIIFGKLKFSPIDDRKESFAINKIKMPGERICF
jgi:hypothetical protein